MRIRTCRIGEIQVDLELRIKFLESVMSMKQVEATISLPANYPPTVMKEKLGSHNLCIISLQKRHMGELRLEAFYLLPREYHLPLTDDEELMLCGLGQAALKKTLRIATDYWSLPLSTPLIVQACGGKVGPRDEKLVETISQMNRLTLLRWLDKYGAIGMNLLDNEDLAREIVCIDNNLRLVRYYVDTYGLTQDGPDGSSVRLIGTIGRALGDQ